MLGKSSSGSMLKWLEQILDYLKLLLSQGYGRLCDAFRMLLTNPTVKRLVVSLAFDEAFWDVILRNTSLQEFQWTHYAELIEIFRTLVNELLQPPKSNNPTEGNKEQMEEKSRLSLLLSVVIRLIVVMARAQTA